MRKLLLVAVFAATILAMASASSAQTQATYTWMPRAGNNLKQPNRITLWGTSTVFLSKTAPGGDFYGVNMAGFDNITADNYYSWTPGGSTITVQSGSMTLWSFPAKVVRNSVANAEMNTFVSSGFGTMTLTEFFGTLAVNVGDDSYTHGVPGAGYHAIATSNDTVGSKLDALNSDSFSGSVKDGGHGEATLFVPILASSTDRIDANDTAEFSSPDLQGSSVTGSGSASVREHSLYC